MGKILCATRGGETSYHTQDAAIALAKSRGDTLIFLYVCDLHFLDKSAAPMVVDAEEEVCKMGEFLLLMAKNRATDQGVDAETILYEGKLREELIKAAQEQGATLVVLGKPTDPESVFQLESLTAFIAEITSQTGIEAQII
jgi:nucleotide-binding universal stress UspA family protein